jgi:hypothetical protein
VSVFIDPMMDALVLTRIRRAIDEHGTRVGLGVAEQWRHRRRQFPCRGSSGFVFLS